MSPTRFRCANSLRRERSRSAEIGHALCSRPTPCLRSMQIDFFTVCRVLLFATGVGCENPALHLRLRPYHVENTGTRPISEVKQRRAWGVLRWVTTWES